jgi:indolepyruvate decarboxylase
VRYGLNPIVLVLNNSGYGTERHIHDGPYNDVAEWKFHRIPEVLGAGVGVRVETEDQFDLELEEARKRTDSFTLIEVVLEPMDRSPALERLTARLAEYV